MTRIPLQALYKHTTSPGLLQQLPLRIPWKVAIDHLGRIRQEVELVVVVFDVSSAVVSRGPVAVEQEPASVDVYGVPTVIGRFAGNLVPRHVAGPLCPPSN